MTPEAALLRVFDMAEDRPDIREVVRAALPAIRADTPPLAHSVCVCGLAESYHPRLVKDGHEYEPRYRADTPPLDVERLATALCASRDPRVFPTAVGDMFVDDECRSWAGRIATEYARLATEAKP